MKLLHVKDLLETLNANDARLFGLFDQQYLLTAVRIDSAAGFAEVHCDGDELLVVLSGDAIFTAERDDKALQGTRTLRQHHVKAGDALWIEKGFEHQVEILEPLKLLAITPAHGNSARMVDERGKQLLAEHEAEEGDLQAVEAIFMIG
jgi:mannose-6-phosphate isomerase-like protein (cupin superfamily)